MLLTDEEIHALQYEIPTAGNPLQFARAVESAVLWTVVEMVRQIEATTIIELLSSMKRGHEIACSEVIAALEGQWKP